MFPSFTSSVRPVNTDSQYIFANVPCVPEMTTGLVYKSQQPTYNVVDVVEKPEFAKALKCTNTVNQYKLAPAYLAPQTSRIRCVEEADPCQPNMSLRFGTTQRDFEREIREHNRDNTILLKCQETCKDAACETKTLKCKRV